MSEVNLDALVSPPKKIKLGGRIFTVYNMTIGSSFKILEKYNEAQKLLLSGGAKRILTDNKYANTYLKKMIAVCLLIVKPRFSKDWFKLFFVNRRWFYKNCNVKQLQAFVKEVMYPLLDDTKEDKKKVQETSTG